MGLRWKTSGKGLKEPFDEGKIDEDSPIKKFSHKTKPPNRKGWEKGKGFLLLTPENRDKYPSRNIREHMKERPIKGKDHVDPLNAEYFRNYKRQYKKYKEKIKKDLDKRASGPIPYLLENSTII